MMSRNNWKTIIYIAGGLAGLLTGLASAHLYKRTAEANQLTSGSPARIEVGDAFKIGLATLALIRQITDLASRKSNKPARR
jgi:hypothetical protein